MFTRNAFFFRFWCWAVLTCLCIGGSTVSGDVYTSVQEMKLMYHREGRLLAMLESAIGFYKAKLDILTRRYSEIVAERPPPPADPAGYLGHPVNTYVLVRRLSRDWPLILSVAKEVFSIPDDLLREAQLSDEAVMEGALRGLTRLQYVYRLEAEDLAKGKVGGVQAVTGLTAADCVTIASWLLHRHEMRLSGDWLMTALHRVDQDSDRTVPVEKIISYIHVVNTLAVCESPDFKPSYHPLLRTVLAYSPSYSLDADAARLYRWALFRDCQWFDRNLQLESADMTPDKNREFNAMCAGPPRRPGGLHCRLVHHDNPALRLAPFKVEEVSISPPILLVHQVVSDREIAEIQKSFLHVMSDCQVVQDGQNVASTHRLCKRGWLEDWATPASGRITRRIGQMANLNTMGSETNQVGCYGLGGEYKSHYDILPPPANMGDYLSPRVATVMLYLSDVVRGGYTVFPLLNIAIAPVKGSAVMWYNSLCDSQLDPRLFHGGCPVLLGAKWVLNKWIPERIQSHCPAENSKGTFTCDYSID